LNKDQVIGALILIASVLGIIVYGWLLFFVAPQLVLQISAFIAILVILGILAWIGWTMATTPPPAPMEAEITTSTQETSTKTESTGKEKID
jgi:predicted DNA-binding transcriptional regulator